jgi:multiple sugar transport system ATP-binding protein
MAVSLRGLVKRFADGTDAVKGIDLEVGDGEFLTLLGPSGCGKTTTLRLIAGLEEPSEGAVWIGGRDVTHADPGDRDVAMVFQSYALYPHMTALQNMTLGLRVAGMPKAAAADRAREIAGVLGIQHLLHRRPAKLSGGERQRVALGRAMVRNPACFLMDEPLSNLDLKLREHMRTELKRLHQRYRVTTIYVTHDQAEALILSDRVAVMSKGEIQQVATPSIIYERPATTFVADFIGSPSMNFLQGEVRDGMATLAGRDVDGVAAKGSGRITLGVRPEDIVLGSPGSGLLDGTVEFTELYGGAMVAFIVPRGQGLLKDREFIAASIDMHRPMTTGTTVGIGVRGSRVSVFDAQTGIALPRA